MTVENMFYQLLKPNNNNTVRNKWGALGRYGIAPFNFEGIQKKINLTFKISRPRHVFLVL